MIDKSLQEMDYKGIFKYFYEISAIPRGSGNEKEISDYLVAFAKEHNLEYTRDEANNVIMVKPATPGYENEPAIILQGHMDMVCEKKKEHTHDFLKDGIKIIVDGDYLRADGTTLGADNGIAVAYILAMFTDETLPHPRLEAIITTDEEVGMHGAKALELSHLQGKYLINLDSEEEGYLLCSCAGGLTGTSTLPLSRVSEGGRKVQINIGGLNGGHSGVEIGKNRTNANKLMARLLFDLRELSSFALIDLKGGFKDNVIPRESEALLLIPADNGSSSSEQYKEFEKNIKELMTKYQHELSSSEPGLNYQITDLGDDTCEVIHPNSFEKLLFMLTFIPNGVQVMSSDIEGLVESSLNMGILKTEYDRAEIYTSIRSSKSSYKYFVSDKLEYLTNFLGGEYVRRWEYPAWEFRKDSKLRDHFQRISKEMYGKEMKVEAIHAGLECGLIAEKMPHLDMVSIGPDMHDVHTIEERLSISSTLRVYKFLERIVSEKIQ